MCCVDFAESASFSSFGVFNRCLHDRFSTYRMNNRNSDGLFSRIPVCRSSDSSYNSTSSSLIIANYHNANFAFLLDLDLMIWHSTRDAIAHYVLVCIVHSCGYSISQHYSTLLAWCCLHAIDTVCSTACQGFCTKMLHSIIISAYPFKTENSGGHYRTSNYDYPYQLEPNCSYV